jgi:cytochrome b involved in lipid metabolism
MREYTRAEVASLAQEGRFLLIIENRVYDVELFLRLHPGGEVALLDYVGRDATGAFGGVGHSATASSQKEQFFVGDLVQSDRA